MTTLRFLMRVCITELLLLTFISQILAPVAFAETEVISQTEMTTETGSQVTESQSGETTSPSSPIEETLSETDSSSGVTEESESVSGSVITTETIPPPEALTGSELGEGLGANPVVAPAQSLAVSPIPENTQETGVKEEILVQFHTNTDTMIGQYQVESLADSHDLAVAEVMGIDNIVILGRVEEEKKMPDPTAEFMVVETNSSEIDAKIEELRRDPRVAIVQKNFIYTLASIDPAQLKQKPAASTKWIHTGQTMPTDTEFSKMWGLHNVGQSLEGVTGTLDADIDYPEAISYASGRLNGSGVIVAVLDSGISYEHPDLKGHLWNGENCRSYTGGILGKCLYGYDFVNNDRNPYDDDYFAGDGGHGTHVAGTIGAITDNSGGVSGIAPNVQIMNIRVCSMFCSTVGIIRGIEFAQKNGAKLINASFGGIKQHDSISDFDLLTYSAIAEFDGLFIAAAGNAGVNTDIYDYVPAKYGSDITVSGEYMSGGIMSYSGKITMPGLENIISVGASTQNDTKAYFSNYGTSSVDISAPGVNIYSTIEAQAKRLSYAIDNTWIATPKTVSGDWYINTSYVIPDNKIPYSSGETRYLEKTFTSSGKAYNKLSGFYLWCDTPYAGTGVLTDYMTIEVNTGGTYTRLYTLDEFTPYIDVDNFLYWDDDVITGHTGSFGYIEGTDFESSGSGYSIRIGWHTDGIDQVENGNFHKGCMLDKYIAIGQTDRGVSGEYTFMDGTSMAAPHVTGAAALAMNFAPDASIQEIKNAILWSADWKYDLSEYVQYGRRLNIYNMLRALEKPEVVGKKISLSGEADVKIEVTTKYIPESIYVDIGTSSGLTYSSPWVQSADILSELQIIPNKRHEAEYRLNDTMTRAESIKVVHDALGYTGSLCTGTYFADVNATLGDLCGPIETLAKVGIINGASVYFNPNQEIQNYESIVILLKALGESPSTHTLSGVTSKTTIPVEYYGYIQKSIELGCSPENSELTSDWIITRGILYDTVVCLTNIQNTPVSKPAERYDTTWAILEREDDTGTGYLFSYSGLKANTKYYYSIQACSSMWCNPATKSGSFITRNIVSNTQSGTIITDKEVYLRGKNASGSVAFSGTASGSKITLINTGSQSKVEIPTHNLKIFSSGSWDSIIKGPEIYTGSKNINTRSGAITATHIEVIGSDTASLSLSGQLATIELAIVAQSGTTFTVMRADTPMSIYDAIGTCVVTNNICRFTTNHFSAFALGNPVPSTTQNAGGNTSGGSGGGGGGISTYSSYGITSPFTSTILSNGMIETPFQRYYRGLLHSGSISNIDYSSTVARKEIQSWLSTWEKEKIAKKSTEYSTLAEEMNLLLFEKRMGGSKLIAYNTAMKELRTKWLATRDNPMLQLSYKKAFNTIRKKKIEYILSGK